jgi:molybdenum cofactor biosynthesis enzyme MoaA
MKIQPFSIVVGSRACNAGCPFCVSHMTGFEEVPKRGAIYVPNFEKACGLARLRQSTTVLMTGKGEPTLYPEEITEYLGLLQPLGFPLIELQTNALDIGWLASDGAARDSKRLTRETLQEWRELGLNTIAISVVSERPEHNAQVYLNRSRHKDYPDLGKTIAYLHEIGFTVRLCVMMHKGAVDSPTRVAELIEFCRAHEVDQLTVRPIRKPEQSHSDGTSQYVTQRGIDAAEIAAIAEWIEHNGTRLMSLMHGAAVYDVSGQNLCLSDCLTLDASGDDIRTLIFYSDGRLAYDWQYDGATILRGVSPEVRAVQIGRRMTVPN